jgi:hypothetical protein
MKISYSDFKNLLSTHLIGFTFSESLNEYRLFSFLGTKEISSVVFKNTADESDFVNNLKSKGNKPIPTIVNTFTDPDGFKFSGKRIISSNITASTTTLDYTLTEDLYLTGFIIKCYGAGHFDYGKLQIVAPIGHIVNPLNQEIVLSEFVESWGLSDDLQQINLYRAKVLSGLKIRIIIYKQNAESNFDIWMNAFLHKKA